MEKELFRTCQHQWITILVVIVIYNCNQNTQLYVIRLYYKFFNLIHQQNLLLFFKEEKLFTRSRNYVTRYHLTIQTSQINMSKLLNWNNDYDVKYRLFIVWLSTFALNLQAYQEKSENQPSWSKCFKLFWN